MQIADTIEVMSDTDNQNVRRMMKLSAPLRLLRLGKFTPDEFRLCGAIEDDLTVTRGGPSGGRWQAVAPGEYIAAPRSTKPARAPQERVPEASWRLGKAKDAVLACAASPWRPWAWAMLDDFLLNDVGLSDLEKRWKQRHGSVLMTLRASLDAVAKSQCYEEVKWRTVIWAEGC